MTSLRSRSLAIVAAVVGMMFAGAGSAGASPLIYHGGSVVRNPQVRVIFWGSNWNKNPGAREQIQGLFGSLSGSNYQGILTQYYDTGGTISPNITFSSWTDQSIAAPSSVNWQHIEEEAQYAVKQQGWPAGGINNLYMVLPAPGSKYQAGFVLGCGSHYFSSALGSPDAYVGWPGDEPFKGCASYDPGKQERAWAAASVTASHEYAEAVTDPVTKKYAGTFTGWITEEKEDEIADKCIYVGGGMANGFYVNYLWDNSQEQCTLSHPSSPPPPPPPVRVVYADASNANSTSGWERASGGPWQQTFLWGHEIAAGSSPETLEYDGTKHVFYVDGSNNNTIVDWAWNPTTGWQQTFFYGDSVAKGTSPSAVVVNGVPHVFFVDASNNNSITDWTWSAAAGWHEYFLYGHPAAAGSSPSAMVNNGNPQVFFVDASSGLNTISSWLWNPSSGWQSTYHFGHKVTKGSSPSAMMVNGIPEVFFSDESDNNTVTAWVWNSSTGWQQAFLYGHPLTVGSSPSAAMVNGIPEVFFSDASDSNTMTAWVWNPSTGWQQAFLYGHPIAIGSSPNVVMEGTTPHVYFVDSSASNTLVDWAWNSTTGWQQTFLFGHHVMANSSPSGF